MSARFTVDGKDMGAVGKAFAYSLMASAIAFLVTALPGLEVPQEYAGTMAVAVPVINTLLVLAKKWAEERVERDFTGSPDPQT